MEKNIVLIHAALGVLFLLYLLVRMLISLFGWRDKEYQSAIRSKFRIPDWTFIILLLGTGIYPIFVLGEAELYHIIKLFLLLGVLWISRFSIKINYSLATLASIVLVGYSGFASFTDSPTFPKEQGTFEMGHPEMVSMSELEKGETIFTTLCVRCHGNDGKKGVFGAADLTLFDLSLEYKIKTIMDGSPLTVMPSFKSELSIEEITAVAKYIGVFVKK